MNQPKYLLATGTKVRTHARLDSTDGMLISDERLRQRRADAVGTINGVVGGHGGDVYWVSHGDTVAPYCFTEFELVKDGSEEQQKIMHYCPRGPLTICGKRRETVCYTDGSNGDSHMAEAMKRGMACDTCCVAMGEPGANIRSEAANGPDPFTAVRMAVEPIGGWLTIERTQGVAGGPEGVITVCALSGQAELLRNAVAGLGSSTWRVDVVESAVGYADAPPSPTPPPDPTRSVWGYSLTEGAEHYDGACDSREEAIAEGRDTYGPEGFYIIMGEYPDPAEAMPDVDSVIDGMNEYACDEWCAHEDWPKVSEEAKAELRELMAAWARKHAAPRFWVAVGEPEAVEGVAEGTDGC